VNHFPPAEGDVLRAHVSIGGLSLWIAKNWELDSVGVQSLLCHLFPGWDAAMMREFIIACRKTVSKNLTDASSLTLAEAKNRKVLCLYGGRRQ